MHPDEPAGSLLHLLQPTRQVNTASANLVCILSKRLSVQAALSACQRLRHLVLCLWLDPGRRSPSPSANVDWAFITEISEALPSLRALEFHFGHYDCQHPDVSDKEREALAGDKMSWEKSYDRRTLHFDEGFVTKVASKDGTGLQLLQLDIGFAIGQENCMRLPATLRYLSTSSRCGPNSARGRTLPPCYKCIPVVTCQLSIAPARWGAVVLTMCAVLWEFSPYT